MAARRDASGSDSVLIETLLPEIQGMRSAVRSLVVRAMWRTGEGDPVGAWQDLLACHRLARQVSQSDSIIAQLVAIAMDRLACHGTVTFLHHSKLAALVPGTLPKLPIDLYVGNPLRYARKDDGGYLLYSLYRAGIDSGGTNMASEIVGGEWTDPGAEKFEISWEESDLVIRVPMPRFRLPDLPEDVE